MKKILILIFVFLALVSCNDKESGQDWSGMEYFTFKISGIVTDRDGNPLAGISVSALGSEVFSRSDGTYFLEGDGESETSIIVNFSDKDGAENGGFHLGTTLNVKLDYIKGEHGPFLGLFGKSGVDAVMSTVQGPSVPSLDPDVSLQ